MVTQYPAQIDNSITLPPIIDNTTPITGGVINLLRDTIIRVEQVLGINPASPYNTVTDRLNALENAIGNTQVISLAGDLGGTVLFPLVIGIQGHPISNVVPITGQVLEYNGIAWTPTNQISGVTWAGDLSGSTNTLQTVISINGASVSVAGSLTIGNTLGVTGSSTLAYSALNLAGGVGYVTGTLPTGNQASQSLTLIGDVTSSGGTTASATTTVTALDGKSITPLADGYLFYNGSSMSWVSITTGSSITWASDLAGSTNTNQYVAAISGNAGTGGSIPINATTLAFADGQVTPSIIQTALPSLSTGNGAAGQAFDITGQAGQALTGGSGTPGTGSAVTVSAGIGGAGVIGNTQTGNGGNINIAAGDAGVGIADAGQAGNVYIVSGQGAPNGSIFLKTGGISFGTTQVTVTDSLVTIANSVTQSGGFFSFTGNGASTLATTNGNTITINAGSGGNSTANAAIIKASNDGTNFSTITVGTNAGGGLSSSNDIYINAFSRAVIDSFDHIQIGGVNALDVNLGRPGITTVVDGGLLVIQGVQFASLSPAGVVHNDASGIISTSLISVGTDITGGTTGQVLITNGTTPTWTTLSGNATVSPTGVITVTAIDGVTVTGTPSSGQVLTATSGTAADWQTPSSSGVTWANDLASSSNTHQYVSGISGSGGTAGTVTLGDGTHNLLLQQDTSLQATPPTLTIQSSTGFSTTGAGGAFNLTAGNSGGGSTNGGAVTITTGTNGGGSGTAGEFIIAIGGVNELVIDNGITTAGTITLTQGDGTNNVTWASPTATSISTPVFEITSALGFSGASTAGNGGQINIFTSSGVVASSGTAIGGSGGAIELRTGLGGAGLGASGGDGGSVIVVARSGGAGGAGGNSGGAGGAVSVTSGNGGTSTSTANNSNGGDITFTTGSAGTGGSGSAGDIGKFIVSIGGTNELVIDNGLTHANNVTYAVGDTTTETLVIERPQAGTSSSNVFKIEASKGFAGASISGAGGSLFLFGGNATVASSGTAAGALGGDLTIESGFGANGLGSAEPGGNAGTTFVLSGDGGDGGATGISQGGHGGTVTIEAGNGGAGGGTGNGGLGGNVNLIPGVGGSGVIAGNPGRVAVQSSFGDELLSMGGIGVGLGLNFIDLALTTGTTTLTAQQASYPYITGAPSSLTGNCTIIFPGGSIGTWIFDSSDVTFNGHSISFEINGNTMTATMTTQVVWLLTCDRTGHFRAVLLGLV